jgi:hypothetical protein
MLQTVAVPARAQEDKAAKQEDQTASGREAADTASLRQTGSDSEAAGNELSAEISGEIPSGFSAEIPAEGRPRRSCAINKYVSANYLLDTKTVSKVSTRTPVLQSPRRSRSLSTTSSRRPGKGSGPTKNPSIVPFLKPTGASSKIEQNEALLKPKVAAAKSCSEPNIFENEAVQMPKVVAAKSCNEPKKCEVKVSQTLMQDFLIIN